MSETARGLALLRRNLENLARAPLALRAVDARFGKGVARRTALRRMVFFPALGIGFNRIKKNANTALLLTLLEMQEGSVSAATAAKDAVPNLFDLPRAELRRFDRYALLVTLRNPYSRVLSAFLDKFRFEPYRRKHGDFALTPEGFDRFLRWLETGGLTRDPHWDLQTKLLALPLDRYDAVLRFETLREDALAFLTARGLTPPPGALQAEHRADSGKQTGADAQLAAFYTPERAALVARLYAADFEALGYDAAPPQSRPAGT